MRNRFKPGSSVFRCIICTRRTRLVDQPSPPTLCPQCDELAMCENSLQDGVQTVAEIAFFRDDLVKKIASKGGNFDNVRKYFKILWEGVKR
jgi:hypothetical protein